jgi:hypothetical protein
VQSDKPQFSREMGERGPVFRQFRHDEMGATEALEEADDGDALAVLEEKQFGYGDVDLVWGYRGIAAPEWEKGNGLSHILIKHPYMRGHLQEMLDRMTHHKRHGERALLWNDQGEHATLALTWFGRENKTWLLTEYDQRPPAAENILAGSGNPVSGASEPSSPLPGSPDTNIAPAEGEVKPDKPQFSGQVAGATDPALVDMGAGYRRSRSRCFGRKCIRPSARAVWLDIPTHRPSANIVYELPFGKGRPLLSGGGRVLQLIAGGWELSGIFSYYSSQFLTPQWTGPDPTGTAFTSSRTPAQVTIRPNHLYDANLPASERSTSRWFDPAAFSSPTPGFFGSAAKGVIKGPPSNVWHLGLSKQFPIGERARLRWKLIAANAFNHPNYANPAVNVSSLAQVSVINVVVGDVAVLDQSGPRKLRMGLTIEW